MGKIAATYIHTQPGNVSANLREIIKILQETKEKGANFVLLPELCLSGYISSEEEINAVLSEKDYAFSQLKTISKEQKLSFVFGFPEKLADHFYISHYLVCKGEIIGIHRKTHLSPTEKCIYSEGNEINIYKSGDLIVGMQLCFESHFPEISYAQAKQGANVLVVSFASPKELAMQKKERFERFLCARAYDNSCYLLACNLAGTTSNGANLPGLAMIIDPKGNVIASETKKGNGFCIADIDTELLKHIYESKMANFNRFKRNDLLKRFYE